MVPKKEKDKKGTDDDKVGVVLLFGHLLHYGLKNIPPATLFLILGQSALFMQPELVPDPMDVCISSHLVYYGRNWLRMILSSFYHGSDMHLYYNMVSLLYKGSWLEKKLGTPYFLYLISVFTGLINVLYVALGFFFSWLFNNRNYTQSCAIGFSGVLFALKVLTTHYAPRGPQLLYGILLVPSKYMYWVELLLIQLFVPNASFVGHLAGILAGLMYIWGPLQPLMHIFLEPGGSSVDPPSGTTSPVAQSGVDNVANRRNQPPGRIREPSLDIAQFASQLQSRLFLPSIYQSLQDMLSGRA